MYKTTIENRNLKGNVKSVVIRNTVTDFIKLSFDTKGLLIQQETPYLLFNNYIYDENNKLLSYTFLVKSLNELETRKMDYDENGFLISGFYGDCENDSCGNCINEKRTYGEIKRIYNEKNQVVEDWVYYGENHFYHMTLVDENGKEWEEDRPIPKESPHIHYQYNELGDITFRQWTDENKVFTDTITYKYDERGNWIERNQTNPFENGATIREILEIYDHCVKRDITYYN